MFFNLRKARKLENKIGKFLDKVSFNPVATIRVKGSVADAEKVITSVQERIQLEVNTFIRLTSFRFDLREKIGNINQTEINGLMVQRECIRAKLAVLDKLKSPYAAPDKTELADILESQLTKAKLGSSYSDGTKHNVGIFSEAMRGEYAGMIGTWNKELEEIEDKLAQKNLSSKVELNGDQVSLLQSVGLL